MQHTAKSSLVMKTSNQCCVLSLKIAKTKDSRYMLTLVYFNIGCDQLVSGIEILKYLSAACLAAK